MFMLILLLKVLVNVDTVVFERVFILKRFKFLFSKDDIFV